MVGSMRRSAAPRMSYSCSLKEGRIGGWAFEHADLIVVPVAVLFEDEIGLVEDANADGDEIDE